jgi:hypothetical protein
MVLDHVLGEYYEFYIYLTDAKIKEIKRHREVEKRRVKLSASYVLGTANKTTIIWIETLLQTPIPEYRKYAIWRILAPSSGSYTADSRKCRRFCYGVIIS